MNFINLEQQEDYKELVLKPIDLKLEVTPDENEGCIQKNCTDLHSCSEEYFAIKNLFSELTDDYQRAMIRQNLGIADEAALLWGKIGGNLANQKDLYKFVQDTVRNDQSDILETLNLELKYWTQQIENKIESLASNITSIQIIPRYAIPEQLPIDVLLTWEYDQPVEAQAVNGITLDPSQRNYIFQNVNDSLSIRLSYLYNGVWLARNINFEVTFPIFYGTSDDISQARHTITDKVKLTADEGKYIYIFTKNESDLSVNGIIGGFIQVGVTQIASARYVIYRSLYPGLGETTVKVNDRE